MRVFLTGFMAAGKSSVGDLLAGEFTCPFVDLDRAVAVAAGQEIGEIFANSGERRFRELEAEELRRTAEVERCVVATGGGTPIDAGNREWMRAHGTIVWLDVAFERLRERIRDGGERPLWGDPEHARQLFDSRLEAYRDCDLAIEAGARTPLEVARLIAETLPAVGLR